jgi:hypothetical protein
MTLNNNIETDAVSVNNYSTQVRTTASGIATRVANRFSNRIVACLAAVAVVGLVTVPAFAVVGGTTHASQMAASRANANTPPILPVQSKPYGRSYGEWSAQFWKWEFSLPVNHHPLFDNADCSTGQSGQVWFLGGTFTTTPGPPGITLGQANRMCTIPSGKALFFPIVNAECSSIQGDCFTYDPAHPPTESDLRDAAASVANLIIPDTLSVTIDGLTLTGLALNQYRVQSPLFMFGPLPDNNILQSFGLNAPAGSTWPSVSDGVHIMVQPLSPGKHTIRFHGELNFGGGSMFIEDITYNLTVTP